MLKYAVVEISGRQYKVSPGSLLNVDYLGDIESLKSDKVLLKVEDDKLLVGHPYTNDTLKFEVLGSKKLPKIRVATYKAKANVRKVRGSSALITQIRLQTQES